MGKTIKKIWNIITSIMVALAVLLAVALVGVRLVGLQVFTVLSGSMEPNYHVGSFIYVKNVDYKELEPGDVITFMLDEDTVATHRITEVVPDENEPETLRYRTKGDANDAEDGAPVYYKNLVGVPVFTIPYLGYLSSWLQTRKGMIMGISIALVLLILTFLPDMLRAVDDGDAKKKKKKRRKGRGKKRRKGTRPAEAARKRPAEERNAE